MNNISPIYNINNAYLPVFKQNEANNSAVTNPINSNASMNGMNALANYNRVSSNTDKLGIPVLSPIDIPDKADEIEGEKTFNTATGEITVTQKDNNNTKHYTYGKNGSYTYEILDDKGNLLFMQCKNITNDGIYTKITKEQPNDSKIYGVQTLYKDGNLEHASKYIIPSKESQVGYPYEDIGYNAMSKTYYVEKCDSNNKTFIQYFDNNLKPIEA